MFVTHVPPLDGDRGGVHNFREAVGRGAEVAGADSHDCCSGGAGADPLALRGGQSGSEIQTPMAIVILCGLTTSTVLNMFVVPTLYMKFGQPPVQSLNLQADER
jgi:hypothetical protein